MHTCFSCHSKVSIESRFCPRCGAPIVADGETRLAYTPTGPRSTSVPPLTPTTDIDHGRFVPGVTLGGRYRIIGRIGRGGMGEVYRADDLRLSQPVALKFLPADLSQDAPRLAQFHAEVRLARQVSHPNVCRVYDVGEEGGLTFLSMEYIDGEDLASLLRRIGRLPQDKALDLARELCAGLAASHERGVIHRDLKPANLMIDGQGHLRITDFGIAAISSTAGAIAGTPGYLAPELLTGGSASVASDIYALGLVLYELFTGKKAFDGTSVAEIVRAQQERMPTNPTTWVRDLDPIVDATILRCLARDPADRPASALSVAAMLPGGDPLAAALARGETPSPQMVAAAGETEAINPARGLLLIGVVVLALIGTLLMANRTYIANMVPLPKPADVLADRAADIIRAAGYTEVIDTADGFSLNNDFIRHIEKNDQGRWRWSQLRTTRAASVLYWYRTSPRAIVPTIVSARSTFQDPPMSVSGQAGAMLDPEGRLLEFQGVPPQYDTATGPAPAADWRALFAAATLDMSRFSPAQPSWTPRAYADARVAWTGTVPENGTAVMRVEAASYRGKPVYFALTGPWTVPSRMIERQRTTSEMVTGAISNLVIVTLLIGAALLAWRNARRGRGDRAGAAFAAMLLLVLSAVARALRMAHETDPGIELNRVLIGVVAIALLDAGLLWVLYMAIEPAVRRFWPDSLMGWSRLVSGRVRDPRVGRDLLLGTVAGIAMALVASIHDVLPPILGAPQPIPTIGLLAMWMGTRVAIGEMLLVFRNAFTVAGLTLFVLVIFRMLLRRRGLAAAAAVIVFMALQAPSAMASTTPMLDLAFALVVVTLTILVAIYLGFLALCIGSGIYQLVLSVPLTTSFGAWYGRPAAWAVFLTLALASVGYWMARGSAPLFGKALLDE